MNQITIDREIAQEVMLALNDRRYELVGQRVQSNQFTVREIITRQIDRVEAAMQVLQEQLGEQWI